jgi:hypothetical protein
METQGHTEEKASSFEMTAAGDTIVPRSSISSQMQV